MYENVPVSQNSAVTENTGITAHAAMRVYFAFAVSPPFLSGHLNFSLCARDILTSLMHKSTAAITAMQA